MTSSCLSQFRGWKIPILIGVWRVQSGISRSLNGVIIYRCKIQQLVDLSISYFSSFHLKFSHHISALWSEAHLVSYSSLWGSFYCSGILYSDVNDIIFNFRNLSVLKVNKYHVLLFNNEETMSFPHYLVVNFCNLDVFIWMYKILIIYEWMDCN